MRQLEQAKKAFPNIYLLVGVTGDTETHMRKGLTVMSAKERSESVRHCKWVDEVVEDCPWVITVDFLEKHGIDYVAHDDLPYGASEGDDIYAPIKEKGMFLVTQRTEGVSTTGIITRIVKDYESYISRQLKRGTSRQELNISWFKKNELDIKRQVSDIRKSIRENWTTTGQELGKEFKQFWQPSGQNSPAPQSTSSRQSRSFEAQDALESPTTASLRAGARSPGGWSRLTQGSQDGPIRDKDFAVGYAMGLIGGVRSWVRLIHCPAGTSPSHQTDTTRCKRRDAICPTRVARRARRARTRWTTGTGVETRPWTITTMMTMTTTSRRMAGPGSEVGRRRWAVQSRHDGPGGLYVVVALDSYELRRSGSTVVSLLCSAC